MKNNKNIAFCLGMHKSGTSWLFEQLYQHSEVNMTQRDSHFFSKESEYSKGIENFESRLNSKLLNIEMGNHYASSPIAIKRILQHYPESKCLVIIRHPVERAISHHRQNIKTGTYPATTGLKEAIEIDASILNFSGLSNQLNTLSKTLNQCNLLVLQFEQIKSDPKLLLEKVQEFLELKVPFKASELNRVQNQARVPKSVRLEQIQNALFYKMQQSSIGKLIWKTLKKMQVGTILRSLNTSNSTVDVNQSERDYLEQMLSGDIAIFESLN